MRLLLASEGERDFGSGEQQGIVGVLVRRVLGAHWGREVSPDEIRVTPLARAHHLSPTTSGYPRKVELAIVEAAATGCSSVAVVVDRDGPGNVGRLQSLVEGRELASANPNPGVPAMAQRAVVGVAIETAEAWLLADVYALNQGLGLEEPPLPAAESIWGAKGTEQHPKGRLDALITKAGKDASSALDEVAEFVDLTVLENSCQAFSALADELRSRCM